MHKIRYNLFPGGHMKCLTMSYDDGKKEDIRLAEFFRANGLKGTFHLNSGRMTAPDSIERGFVPFAELAEVYAGHEISCHMVNHPFPRELPDAAILAETIEDRRALEKACGYVVRGMSYPYGNYDARVIDLIKTVGIEYSRTVKSTAKFDIPENFLEWHPTCHHNKGLFDRLAEFDTEDKYKRPKLFYVWGHSFEFPVDNNWGMMEEFCKRIGGREDIWYATNIEIVDYVNALRALRISVDCDKLYNPSAITVWVTVDGEPIKLAAGETVVL